MPSREPSALAPACAIPAEQLPPASSPCALHQAPVACARQDKDFLPKMDAAPALKARSRPSEKRCWNAILLGRLTAADGDRCARCVPLTPAPCRAMRDSLRLILASPRCRRPLLCAGPPNLGSRSPARPRDGIDASLLFNLTFSAIVIRRAAPSPPPHRSTGAHPALRAQQPPPPPCAPRAPRPQVKCQGSTSIPPRAVQGTVQKTRRKKVCTGLWSVPRAEKVWVGGGGRGSGGDPLTSPCAFLWQIRGPAAGASLRGHTRPTFRALGPWKMSSRPPRRGRAERVVEGSPARPSVADA